MWPRIAFAAAALSLMAQISAWPAPADSSEKPIGILLAAGDIAECKPNGQPAAGYKQKETAALLGKEIADATMRGIPIRVLALGDLAYKKGTQVQFDRCFHISWGQHIKSILPVPGNHEYYSKDTKPYFDYFAKHGRKMVSENGPAAGPKVGYYTLSFPAADDLSPDSKIKPWRLIALNSRKGTPPPDQLDWLKRDLRSNDNRCVLAFAHFFAFSSSRHGHEPPDFKPNDAQNRKKPARPDLNMVKVLEALYANGPSLLVSGHDHGYEQFKRQDAMQNVKDDGLRSFIVGTGGATFYGEPYDNPAMNSEKRQTKWHGVLKLELFETRYRWRFVPIDMKPVEAAKIPVELTAPTEEDCNMRKTPPT
jgi:hypothetical protein